MAASSILALASSLVVDLAVSRLAHVEFSGIPPTRYANEGGALVMTVEKSASFLLLPYDAPRTVSGIAFEWKATGAPAVASAEVERTKKGDDLPLRVGLVLAGKAPMVPFFAPAWIKAIRDTMKLPADRLLYVAAGARNPPGARWKSPHSDSMEILALGGTPVADGWQRVQHTFEAPLTVVGVWIMADGDDTGASFTTMLRSLTLP